MLSKQTLMVGIFAILVGLVAAWGVRQYLEKKEDVTPPAAKAAAPDQFKIPLAAVDLPADRVVVGQDTYVQPMTQAEFEKQFPKVNMKEVLASVRSVVNRQLKKPVKQGQPFLTTDFYLMGTGPSVAARLQPGFRAVRVEVPANREAGVQKGMYVDVLFRANARAAKAGQPVIPEKTVAILRHVEVLEAEGGAKPGSKEAPRTKPMLFTLAVPEEKVDMFGVIAGRGELWLVPTPSAEKGNGAGGDVADASTLADLLGIKPRSAPPPPFETAIYRRGQMQINQFVDGKLVARHGFDRALRMSDESGPSGTVTPMPEAPEAPPAPAQP